MAEKGFGVKEVNLIGASGTPTITSPNNLNLNANNVAISTNVSIGGTLTVTGNVSVGGTLTYEDVTSIDSVGIVTARTGVVTPNIDVDDFVTVGSNIQLGNAGVVTATTFSGSAASLTNLPVADSDIQVAYTVTANGSSAYRFAGNGVVSTADDPDLYLIRGKKYRFVNNSGGSHPFQIREASGGTAYSTGVTNNGAASGNIDFAPTFDSPAQLVYQCTSHSGMVGNIYLRDAAGNNTNVGVTTFVGGNSHIALTNSSNTPKIQFKANNVADAGKIQVSESSGGGTLQFFSKTTGGTETERVRITTAGVLEINGMFCAGNPSNFSSVSSTQGSRITGQQGSHPACLSFDGGGAPTLELGSTSGQTIIGTNGYNSSPINFKTGMGIATLAGGTTRFQINTNGNIGAPTGNNIYNASDERLKENMVELTDGLSKIQKLKPISFTWKEGWDVNLDGKKEYGFGAQTTEAVDEMLVEPFSLDDAELNGEIIEKPLRVNEKYIIPLLVKAVQELSLIHI